jgi:hypothetical protein
MPRCKNCKEKFEPIRFNHKYCLKDECVRTFVQEVKENSWKSRKKKMTEDLKTTQDWMKEAQVMFNRYIRLRDKDQNCISCGSKLGAKYDAGHYFSSGGHRAVTFDENNVHAQCVHCNQHLSGNLLNYQLGIEKRIGADKLIELYEKAYLTKKFSVPELQEIILVYRQKIKELQS